jgi:D-xylose transport system ATP-binding protein
MPDGPPVLAVKGLTKRFGAVTALDGVDLTLHAGEVLALLGDNGAGKSTLIKCVSGVHQPDDGTIEIGGEVVAPRSPADARRHGIETVYQDLALFDNRDPAANFFAGRELAAPGRLGALGLVRRREMEDATRRVLADLEVGVKSTRTPVGLMSGGQRQAIAVGRAVAFASRVVVLDEPTAALGVRESATVLELIRRLPARGVGVVLVSHNLEHVMRVADRAVVLRQGVKAGEAVPAPENHEALVSMIVGARRPAATGASPP